MKKGCPSHDRKRGYTAHAEYGRSYQRGRLVDFME